MGGGVDATSIYSGWRPVGAAKHLIMTRTVPTTKKNLAQNVHGAKAEKVQGIFSLSDHKMIPPAIVLFKYDHKKCST